MKEETDLYQMYEIMLCSYFSLHHTSSFEIIDTGFDDFQFV